jgi:ABC-type bacteriocin/lantibiotic exporter with double-glycine peptidase domain
MASKQTIVVADKIVVMDQGLIVGASNHQELVNLNGYYKTNSVFSCKLKQANLDLKKF